MRAGGFHGDFVPFLWQTGLGAVADQNSSVAFKRTEGARLAAGMRRYRRDNPSAPIYIIGIPWLRTAAWAVSLIGLVLIFTQLL